MSVRERSHRIRLAARRLRVLDRCQRTGEDQSGIIGGGITGRSAIENGIGRRRRVHVGRAIAVVGALRCFAATDNIDR